VLKSDAVGFTNIKEERQASYQTVNSVRSGIKNFIAPGILTLVEFSGNTIQLRFDSTHNLDGVTINNELQT